MDKTISQAELNTGLSSRQHHTSDYHTPVLFLAASVLLTMAFSSGLSRMVLKWSLEEYSHGYFIPLVSLFLILQKLPQVIKQTTTGSWLSVPVIVFGLALLLLGELSTLYPIIQYGFLICVVGLFFAGFGWTGLRLLWAPIAYLIFMIPLPNFLYFNLSSQLQLLSSFLGVIVIRLSDISVFLEGNVIDLGSYQLQVVEACSGLRYLFPLMSFGFLISYIYKGPVWQKIILFLTTIPITVLMNSFRIAVIGITVNYWGISAAEGFLHDFEGWVVFMACLGLLGVELWLMHKMTNRRGALANQLNLDLPDFKGLRFTRPPSKLLSPLTAITLLALIAVPLTYSITDRNDQFPERVSFNHFPLFNGDWTGYEGTLDGEIIESLQVTDYLVADYVISEKPSPVNLYVAYYNSQRKGASIHSPRSCIPGDGWRLSELEQMKIPQTASSAQIPLRVNRAIIQKGEQRSLVYYWFQQRGRVITNEYFAKWYLFWDSLTINRTDGALVRLVTPIEEGMDASLADQHLQRFLRDFSPLLSDYIPD